MRQSRRRTLSGICAIVLMVTAAGALAVQDATAATVNVSSNITTSQTWTKNNDYRLTQPVYVTGGATLTIQAGTVIRGEPTDLDPNGNPLNNPGTLIIARGSKIFANGTMMEPIVFTDLADDHVRGNPGTDPYDTFDNATQLVGRWGGLILLGRTYVANNTGVAADPNREVQIEGLTAAGGLGLYGNGGNDNDDSGSISYVIIRYGGFNLSANNEINGLTLGAVGRETDIDYVEVFQNKDDGIELFGGTVNVKHAIVADGGDDGIDYDEGYRGKVQFVLVLQGTPGSDKSDKGGRARWRKQPRPESAARHPRVLQRDLHRAGIRQDHLHRPLHQHGAASSRQRGGTLLQQRHPGLRRRRDAHRGCDAAGCRQRSQHQRPAVAVRVHDRRRVQPGSGFGLRARVRGQRPLVHRA